MAASRASRAAASSAASVAAALSSRYCASLAVESRKCPPPRPEPTTGGTAPPGVPAAPAPRASGGGGMARGEGRPLRVRLGERGTAVRSARSAAGHRSVCNASLEPSAGLTIAVQCTAPGQAARGAGRGQCRHREGGMEPAGELPLTSAADHGGGRRHVSAKGAARQGRRDQMSGSGHVPRNVQIPDRQQGRRAWRAAGPAPLPPRCCMQSRGACSVRVCRAPALCDDVWHLPAHHAVQAAHALQPAAGAVHLNHLHRWVGGWVSGWGPQPQQGPVSVMNKRKDGIACVWGPSQQAERGWWHPQAMPPPRHPRPETAPSGWCESGALLATQPASRQRPP